MGTVTEVVESIRRHKIIAIMRNVPTVKAEEAAEALYAGGVCLIEVTFNQSKPETWPETARCIQTLNARFDGRMYIGAGTVMSPEQARLVSDAGALFMISPNVDIEVIRLTKELGAVSIPGALTPTDIATAWNAGADFVKLFPADVLGMGYIKAIRSPLNHIPLLAVGGITDENLAAFLAAGCVGVGVGSNLVDNKLISEGKWAELTALAIKYTSHITE